MRAPRGGTPRPAGVQQHRTTPLRGAVLFALAPSAGAPHLNLHLAARVRQLLARRHDVFARGVGGGALRELRLRHASHAACNHCARAGSKAGTEQCTYPTPPHHTLLLLHSRARQSRLRARVRRAAFVAAASRASK